MTDRMHTLLATLGKEFSTLYGWPHLCPICGMVLEYIHGRAIADDLATDWRLSEEQRRFFDFREGCACKHCGSSVRRMQMGRVLLELVNLRFGDNLQFVKDLPGGIGSQVLRVAEINNCGTLHRYLRQLPGLVYSEYGSMDPLIPSEDLTRLSYADESFDLVLTSDVLEHVPDFRQALLEVQRILKKDGVFIFTVPYLLDRQTLTRAVLDGTGVQYLRSPSYHGEYQARLADYLVFYEFGYDLLTQLQEFFNLSLYGLDGYGGPISSVFVGHRH